MFEFEYDNFLDECNGLKIVIRNTSGGQLVCYSIDNDGVQIYQTMSEKLFGSTFLEEVRTALSWIFLFSTSNNEKYFMMKKVEVTEIIEKQAKQFLLDYFQAEDMRDLVARDEFFDKQMFTS